jgi:hypothetical protein
MGKMDMDLYHPISKVIFGWTAKAGCTVVVKMFLDHCGLLDTALAYHEWVHNYRGAYLGPAPPHCTVPFIKFVRNPYSRAVSSYLGVAYGRQIFPMLESVDHFSFETFLQYLVSDTVSWDIHFDKQFCPGEIYDEIVPIEKMDEIMPRINQKYGLSLNWKFTSSHHFAKDPTMETDYQGAKDFSKVRHPIGSYKQFYNDENRKLVELIYGEDILHYGYTYDDFLHDKTV